MSPRLRNLARRRRREGMTLTEIMIVVIIIDAGRNPFLIAGIGPFPELCIIGSGVATMVANIVSFFGLLIVVYWRDLPIRLRGAEQRYLWPEPALLRLIAVATCAPRFVMSAANSLRM